MKLSINQESLYALRTLSMQLPKVLDDLYEQTRVLFQTYRYLKDELGPHEQQYVRLLQNIEQARDIADDALRELSFMLEGVADRMEQYLHPYGTAGVMLRREAYSLTKEHREAVQLRLHQGGNPSAIALYQKWQHNVHIFDDRYTGLAYYDALASVIRYSAMEDLHHSLGACSCYFHEVGHMIDDHAGRKHGTWISDDKEFLTCLHIDFQTRVRKVMLEKQCCQKEAYALLSEDLWDYRKGEISDIYGSLSDCQCQGCWGHDVAYWNQENNRNSIQKEAFANMFEVSIGDEEKLKQMKEYLPRSYARFDELMKQSIMEGSK